MTIVALCIGAFLIGWFLPEMVLCLSTRLATVPLMMNFLVGVGLALIAYGLKA
jgi:hypothetical protein